MILELLDNIAAQSWSPLEVIVIDDGSTDDTAGGVRRWVAAHPRQRVSLLTQSNGGPGSARNRGFRASQGEFIFCVDSDDLIYPNAINAMVGAIRSSGRPYCLAGVAIVGIGRAPDSGPDFGQPRQNPANILLNGWMTHGALYRRTAVALAGPYNPALLIGEDTDFHWRIALMNGPGHILGEDIGVRREHDFGYLAMGRDERALCRDSVAVWGAFQTWAGQNDKLTRAMSYNIARGCLIAGIKLGYLGDWQTKNQAFNVIAATRRHGIRWSWVASTLGRPNRRSYFLAFRLALGGVKVVRNVRNALHGWRQRHVQRTVADPPLAIRTT